MIRYLSLGEVLDLYQQVMAQSGGSVGILSLSALESSLVQPRMAFDGADLYPTVVDKAAVLGFSLIQNHPFVDGNKRAGHAAMETFLLLNGFELVAPVEEQEEVVLSVASGGMSRERFTEWLHSHVATRARS